MDYYNSTTSSIDQGPKPFVTDLKQDTISNNYFRTARWTCKNMQLALMSVPVGTDIGLDVHQTSDQFFYIEQGSALVVMGSCQNCLQYQAHIKEDYAVMVPAGIWHNIINTDSIPLKMFTIYAPSLHPHGSTYRTKEESAVYENME
ncbi:mannose-6-phosphate isomerase-like protein (cupin superfamily) [Kineothrix alysoides]|uniref:Mannose-6-phosphate isomerase-like protein (Cupin superfamily) n=1 Tax=Kineothrix alysoides TaxID=1469948 RepID=A0A4R1QWB4_9FIRM|nr:cupin domain-containing protein [Kineothrix alysoides]TCL55374.1 mannose-6-phosphate isomerase-like protein (cupin superfamily) [Kineothrix alysoides]